MEIKILSIKDFLTNVHDYDNLVVLHTKENSEYINNTLVEHFENFKNSTKYVEADGESGNINTMTYDWMNTIIPDNLKLNYTGVEFKGVNKNLFFNENVKSVTIPRITFHREPSHENKAIAVEHISEYVKHFTKFDIKAANGTYKLFNHVIVFGVYVIFCM